VAIPLLRGSSFYTRALTAGSVAPRSGPEDGGDNRTDRADCGPFRRTYFLAVALLLAFLVGSSRLYLGVHYPTDVLSGWAAGLAWAHASVVRVP
jgi:membrane-associated phospholipid phosphatase